MMLVSQRHSLRHKHREPFIRLLKLLANGAGPMMTRSDVGLCWLLMKLVSQSVLLRASLVSTSASFTDGVRDWIS
jgi:hypothetical protein